MPRYHTLGDIPKKRHTIFKNKNGGFYYEELFGTIGFDGMSSLMYHTQRPTQVKEILKTYSVSPKAAIEQLEKWSTMSSIDPEIIKSGINFA